MDRTTQRTTEIDDATLVAAALGGDRDALGSIYDRYADRVHTMCVHMLRDRDEAADVCGEVFLVAFDRLGQLRDPERLRSWLFAITRHEVYRRTRRRRRTELVEEVDEMDRIAGATVELDEEETDPAELAAVVRDGSAGLDDRDRMVMELQLQGLDGEELASALGTSITTAYQRTHRMRERLERSIGAVVVARQGRADCPDLDRLLFGWDGTFSVLWRKRVARHVDGCDVCDRRRRGVPALLLGGGAVAATLAAASPVSAAPASVRERVLEAASVESVGIGRSDRPRGWRSDGFPPADAARLRRAVLVAAVVAAAVAIAIVVVVASGPGSDEQLELVVGPDGGPSTTTSTPTTLPATSAATPTADVPAADGLVVDAAELQPAPDQVPTTSPGPPDVATPAPPAPGPLPPSPSPNASPAPSTTAVPSLRVAWMGEQPDVVFHPTPGTSGCGASTPWVVAAPDATTVELWWSSASSSGVVPLASDGATWSGVLEVPPSVTGQLTVVVVGTRAGSSGATPAVTPSAAPCPTPG